MRKLVVPIIILAFVLLGLSVFAQEEVEDEAPILEISGAGKSCSLAEFVPEDSEATPEAENTPEPETTAEADKADYPIITLGDDCEDVIPKLTAASNGTVWIAISMPDEEDWQEFSALEEDDFPPQFDKRGRFIGCHNPHEGEQICSVLWENEEIIYLIEIPIFVGDAYTPRTNTSIETSSQAEASTGEWGACGSCDSCGADSSQCVLSPSGACVADPKTCSSGISSSPANSGGTSDGYYWSMVCETVTVCNCTPSGYVCESHEDCRWSACADPNYGGPCGWGGKSGDDAC